MDPVANIIEQRELARLINAATDTADKDGKLDSVSEQAILDHADRLAELVLALDEWRRKGGYDPYDPAGE